ncbi:Alpha-tubulin suppressor and related RCC1 domain-containing protein [Orpheovirus IHUMI-LCC2]|uniref:Alpha-tubulin suppressor and related RCC1 domain-containing protein n=1 Tax=Orpheovirus IHUMI-LCC2 TaxID=2023057 RepID=A0A2I2L3C6_9VIRU|nr:Alpha-tubulin suppressor and related RCC1 domain-containing protein [Orpheovirus IHUMI-LCC2]SNW62042.1 Alpha-tubulin suppressor and related RCC1 domain-containing protein [Orpheovirus IHUMI-LCC2]
MNTLPNDMIMEIGMQVPAMQFPSMASINKNINYIIGSKTFKNKRLGDKYGTITIYSQENKKGITIPNVRAKSIRAGHDYIVFIGLDNRVYIIENKEGKIEGWIRSPPKLIFGGNAKQISSGPYHLGIIDSDRNVWMYGSNLYGRLGFAPLKYIDNVLVGLYHTDIPIILPNIKAKQISCGGYHTGIIDIDGNIIVFGSNSNGQLGLGTLQENNPIVLQNTEGIQQELIPQIYIIQDHTARYISCGSEHTAFIDLQDNLWTFGSNGGEYYNNSWGSTRYPEEEDDGVENQDGRLGLGDNIEVIGRGANVIIPTQVIGVKAKLVSCGEDTTLVIDIENNILICGNYFSDDKFYLNPIFEDSTDTNYIYTNEGYIIFIDGNYNLWTDFFDLDRFLYKDKETLSASVNHTYLFHVHM